MNEIRTQSLLSLLFRRQPSFIQAYQSPKIRFIKRHCTKERKVLIEKQRCKQELISWPLDHKKTVPTIRPTPHNDLKIRKRVLANLSLS